MTAAAVLAAHWFATVVQVQRLSGSGAYGPVYAAAADVRATVDAKARLVRDPGGAEVVSGTTLYVPSSVDEIPPGSLVTLPVSHGSRTATVITSGLYDSGRSDVPAVREVMLT